MTVRTVLKMGDPRLLRVARPVTAFDTQELHQLLTDLLLGRAPIVDPAPYAPALRLRRAE